MYMYMYMYMFKCTCINVHVYVFVYVYVNVYVYVYVYVYVHTHICLCNTNHADIQPVTQTKVCVFCRIYQNNPKYISSQPFAWSQRDRLWPTWRRPRMDSMLPTFAQIWSGSTGWLGEKPCLSWGTDGCRDHAVPDLVIFLRFEAAVTLVLTFSWLS